jgi:hypothetical protein
LEPTEVTFGHLHRRCPRFAVSIQSRRIQRPKRQRGVLNLAHNLHDVRESVRRVEANRLNGVDAEWLDADQVREFCPIIDVSPEARYPVMGATLQRRGGIARHDAVIFALGRACDALGVSGNVFVEPGRALVASAAVTVYRVGTIKHIPNVRTYVAVDGGMSDNPRPMMYDAHYEAFLPARVGAMRSREVRVVGKHCESGDVLIEAAPLAEVAPGDLLVVAATGAYGHAMANNYNGVPRPPVIFCSEGEARVVVRRETWQDLSERDV